jgi:hypothetical protein
MFGVLCVCGCFLGFLFVSAKKVVIFKVVSV